MRKIQFANNKFYHVYNRGTDKREVFKSEIDTNRFLQSLVEFNSDKPIGSLHLNSFLRKRGVVSNRTTKLVDVVAYCLNPNHYHLILKQNKKDGISQFMKRLGGGYTRYFNEKYKRSGVLFQGKFKAVHIASNKQLLYVSAYVNLNNKAHKLSGPVTKLVRSSWNEYLEKSQSKICNKKIILEQFKNKKEYEEFALDSLRQVRKKKEERLGLEEMLIENI